MRNANPMQVTSPHGLPLTAISTALTKMLQIQCPIVCAPMCGMSMGRMAGAVAAAGGVGLIGIGSSRIFGPDRVRKEFNIAQEEIKKAGTRGGSCLGFGFVESFMDGDSGADESLDACLELEPDVIFFSGFVPKRSTGGDKNTTPTTRWVQRVREHAKCSSAKPKIFVQTFTVEEAVGAATCDGVDAVVIQGCDAGGHGRQHLGASILSLVPQTKRALSSLPQPNRLVIAAGGIVSGAQMAAALALGADGVLLGSAFVVSDESVAKSDFKERILRTADGTSGTIVSTAWDQLSRMGGPFLDGGFTGRALRDSEAVSRFQNDGARSKISAEDVAWYANADYKTRAVWCSTSIGLVDTSTSAAEIVNKVSREAIETLSTPGNFELHHRT